jgi:hypothetical protein
MKIKFNIPQKNYVELIQYIAHLDTDDFQLSYVDLVNIRTLYVDAMNKYEKWRHNIYYHHAIKDNVISMELNLWHTLERISWQMTQENYEYNLLRKMNLQARPQIDHYFFINQSTLKIRK